MARNFVLILLTTLGLAARGQDSLPNFSAKIKSGKVIVSWNNPLQDVVQINIQRSADSLKGFKTILTVADPAAITNGYLDQKPPDTRQFYRLYVQQQGGKYFFTNANRPVLDTARAVAKTKPVPKSQERNQVPAANPSAQPGPVRQNQGATPPPVSTVESIEEPGPTGRIEKNGIPRKKLSNTQRVGLEPEKANAPEIQEISAPSVFVYTNPQGHVVVALPPEKTNQYTLKFFRDDGTPLFTMNKIRDHYLTIDKTNFVRSGWFRFELYENNALKEKNKFFIPKENF